MKDSLSAFQTGPLFSNVHSKSLYSEQVYYRSHLYIIDYFLKCLKNNKLYTYVRIVTLQL